jgi:chemotaxis signal transduction protein
MMHASQTVDGARGTRRMLLFRLGERSYAVGVDGVGGLVACGPIRPLPGAPASVAGLVEWRGNVLTVIDLPRMLGRNAGTTPPCLVRLRPPLQRTALLLPSRVRMVEIPIATVGPETGSARELLGACEGRFEHEGAVVHLFDPLRLVRGTERAASDRG